MKHGLRGKKRTNARSELPAHEWIKKVAEGEVLVSTLFWTNSWICDFIRKGLIDLMFLHKSISLSTNSLGINYKVSLTANSSPTLPCCHWCILGERQV